MVYRYSNNHNKSLGGVVEKREDINFIENDEICVSENFGSSESIEAVFQRISRYVYQNIEMTFPEIDYVTIELLVASGPDRNFLSIYDCKIKNATEEQFFTLIFDAEVVDQLEHYLLKVYELALQGVQFNKAKITIKNSPSFNFLFEYKFDSDFEWFKHLHSSSDEYSRLSSYMEDKIQSWDGLSEDCPKKWIH